MFDYANLSHHIALERCYYLYQDDTEGSGPLMCRAAFSA